MSFAFEMSDDSQARQKKFFSEISRAVPFPSGPHNENKEKPLVLLTAEDFVSVNNTATFVEKYVRTSTKSKHIHLVEEKKSELLYKEECVYFSTHSTGLQVLFRETRTLDLRVITACQIFIALVSFVGK